MDNQLQTKLKKIKLLIMDVDGTLTDAAMFYNSQGEFMKRFYTRDGFGIDMMHKAGLKTAIITQEYTDIVMTRAKKLKIDKVVMGSTNKANDFQMIAEEYGLTNEEIAYIGDDLNDIPALKLAGLAVAPNDCSDGILDYIDYKTTKNGGNGAVRELIDMILKSQNFSLYS